jgi:UDP:flavonoid glycosyltransferase YjiC (YdhE family)
VRIAHLCSAHGFGHLTRQLAVAEELRGMGAEPVLFTAAPASVVEEYLPGTAVVPWRIDVGICQPDSLTEDIPATLTALEAACSEARIDALADALRGFDRAVVDIAPVAMEAARRAGVPVIAAGNFDWPWIYRHYPALHGFADRLAAMQAPHRALFLTPGPGLFGFHDVTTLPLVGRRRPAAPLPPRTVLVSFGGFGLDAVADVLPEIPGVTWATSPPMLDLDRPDSLHLDAPYPALVAGADAVLTKPGYGIHAECALAGTPMVWVERGAFPEAPHLIAAMSQRGAPVGCGPGEPAFPSRLAAALEVVFSRPPPEPVSSEGAAQAARAILATPAGWR